MRSATRWVIEIIVVSVVLLVFGWVITHGFDFLFPGGNPTPLESALVAVYLVLVGLVVELIRWARDSVEGAAGTVQKVLADELTVSAEKAVRGAILRSIFPSGNPDPVNARIHFGIVEDYLTQVERWPPLIQRASGTLAQRHLAAWRREMDDLTSRSGLALQMDESARMSAAMMDAGTKYMMIERWPCDPKATWSPGFLNFIEKIGSIEFQKKFVVLADSGVLQGPSDKAAKARELYLLEEEYLRRQGFKVYFCDIRRVYKELGTTEIPMENFEVFSDQVALQMDPAESYDRTLSVRLYALSDIGDLRRFLQIVDEQAQPVTSRKIKVGNFG
jgi:hypothetical protein